MKLADLHCDTPLEMYKHSCNLENDLLHISLAHTNAYEAYIQCAAIWSDYRLHAEEAFDVFKKAAKDFRTKAGSLLCTDGKKLTDAGTAFILCVEDARILCGNMDRLFQLYLEGIRVLTLVWKGHSEIGGGWDTNEGLTLFGHSVVEACFALGIIPDISHGSWALCKDVLKMAKDAGKPVIATHSNAYAVTHTSRNIPDTLFRSIAENGGVTGISLCPAHLTADSTCTSDDVLRHIEHYISIAGEAAVCLGCDFDGIDETPEDLYNISCMESLYDKVSCRLGSRTADKIFFENAFHFLKKHV